MPELSVTLIRSPIGYRPEARATVRAIGLRRIHQTVIVRDTESVRGMLASIPFLLLVEPHEDKGDAQPVTVPSRIVVTKAAMLGEASSQHPTSERNEPRISEPALRAGPTRRRGARRDEVPAEEEAGYEHTSGEQPPVVHPEHHARRRAPRTASSDTGDQPAESEGAANPEIRDDSVAATKRDDE